jgi:hypothetical protein
VQFIAYFIKRPEHCGMIKQFVQHPGMLGTLTWKYECDAHGPQG